MKTTLRPVGQTSLYTFQWAPPTDQPNIECLAENAGEAWFKACDLVGCLPDELILLYVSPVDQGVV